MPEEHSSQPPPVVSRTTPFQDHSAGAALGALLGLLMGMSTSPVVSIVITGLVALLGAAFGLAEGRGAVLSRAAARRLAAFGLAAALVTPAAVWVRTHQYLSPSIEEHLALLEKMGVTEKKARNDLLLFLHFGIPISRADEAAPALGHMGPTMSGLYSANLGFCERLMGLKMTGQDSAEYRRLFADGDETARKLGNKLATLPEPQQHAAFEAAPIFLCMQ